MRPAPSSIDEIVAAYDSATNELRDELKKMPDDAWNNTADFIVGEASLGAQKYGDWLWGFLFDMVHHRGQLSSYLRPMGGKVPAIYGPSGDSES